MPWICSVLAFLLGGIPFSWLLVWWLRGVDLRTVGSGNPGATNAIRVVGVKWGALAMALDVGKGLAAVWLIPKLAGETTSAWLPAVCGCAAILGNVFCPFLRFKGGKAVATAGGVFLGLAPLSTLLVAVVFFSLLKTTQKTSIASLTCAAMLPLMITVQWWKGIGDEPSTPVLLLAWGAALLVLIRHRENIQRLLRGNETAITEGSGKKS
jgi:acyl phosphate:glycerol-3-phosphate acyltransferase